MSGRPNLGVACLVMVDPLSLAIAAGSFAVSATTAWLTLLRPGHIKMTRPTLFYLGPDGAAKEQDKRGTSKVFVRAFLHSTNTRGKLIENMFVTLSVPSKSGEESSQRFNIWIYRDEGRLSRGSGLHVDQERKALDHHFLIPPDDLNFKFIPGNYTLRVYAQLVGKKHPNLLQVVTAELPESIAHEMIVSGGGAFFDWAPDLEQYYVHSRPPPEDQTTDLSLTNWMRTKAYPRPTP
jgi:hypothetical protein